MKFLQNDFRKSWKEANSNTQLHPKVTRFKNMLWLVEWYITKVEIYYVNRHKTFRNGKLICFSSYMMLSREKRISEDMVDYKEYFDQFWTWKDEQQIKVVRGILRFEKSVLLKQYQHRFLENIVMPEQIISINFENLDFELLKDCMKLNNYLKERLCTDKMTYIFLDKVHKLPLFEIVWKPL